jgi:hypothetical protein
MLFRPDDEGFTGEQINAFETHAYDSDDNDSTNLQKDFVCFLVFLEKLNFSVVFFIFEMSFSRLLCFIGFIAGFCVGLLIFGLCKGRVHEESSGSDFGIFLIGFFFKS